MLVNVLGDTTFSTSAVDQDSPLTEAIDSSIGLVNRH